MHQIQLGPLERVKIVSHVTISYNEYLDLFPKIMVQHEGPEQAHLIFPLQPCLRALRVLRGKKMSFEKLSNKVIGRAIEVHSCLGPRLLESTYEQCLAHELHINGINFNVTRDGSALSLGAVTRVNSYRQQKRAPAGTIQRFGELRAGSFLESPRRGSVRGDAQVPPGSLRSPGATGESALRACDCGGEKGAPGVC